MTLTNQCRFVAPSVAIFCVLFLAVWVALATWQGTYKDEALLMFTYLFGVTNVAILLFSNFLFFKAEVPRVKARLKTQLTAIKSGFAVTLAFIASIPLFSTEDPESNAIMSDIFLFSILACALLSVPFFYSTYLLNHLEED